MQKSAAGIQTGAQTVTPYSLPRQEQNCLKPNLSTLSARCAVKYAGKSLGAVQQFGS
jgi:hypothetical protein